MKVYKIYMYAIFFTFLFLEALLLLREKTKAKTHDSACVCNLKISVALTIHPINN